MDKFSKSAKLDHVCYDIRGPVHKKALQLEEEGHKILKLNIGNPAPFGFEAPDEILVDVIRNLPTSQGYCDSKGLYSARKAIVHYYQTKGLRDITVNDVYIGNGVSELITMSMQALLNDGDEILIPAPDYPLWTAAATLAGGTVRHYLCDEENGWFPDLADMEAKITPKTKAIVVINPNNPTGAVYSKEILLEIAELARKHGLIIYADEIYDKILYDGAVHHHIAALAPDLLTITFNGLSKAYRVAGFRQGWMVLNGIMYVSVMSASAGIASASAGVIIAVVSALVGGAITIVLTRLLNRAGVGTVIGGASHAVAYGLIFESLGRATLQALEHSSQGALNTQNIMPALGPPTSDRPKVASTLTATSQRGGTAQQAVFRPTNRGQDRNHG
ncbi:MAG: aminotransferase class I/II-fold pyridoxal phosphate-dependent enzyme [Neisseria elongata]